MSNRREKNVLGVIKFFSELYMLKRNKRSGLAIIDAPPDSIADHVTLTAQIAFILAKMEGLNAERCAVIALFHDNDETRLGDLHKIATRYLEKDPASLSALRDQLGNLPPEIRKEILTLSKREGTSEGDVLHDADWLEVAFQAKILEEKGYKTAQDWVEYARKVLKTKSARKILKRAQEMSDFTNCWWEKERRRIMEEVE